jgi:predicted DNA-binding transcriptional regulator AlpA
MIQKYVRAEDVAAYTALSVNTIRAYVLQKKIPYIKRNGVVIFDLNEIDTWLQQGRVPVLDRCNSPRAEA